MSSLSSNNEVLIAAYESAWASGDGPPDLRQWISLREVPDEVRTPLLLELACIDLEWRWRQADRAEPWCASDYGRSFAELGLAETLPAELIAEEYRAKSRHGKVDKKSFFARPGYEASAARQLVEEIDRELARERGTLPPVADVSSRSLPPPVRFNPSESNLPLADFSTLTLRRIVGAGRSSKVYEATMNKSGNRVAAKFLRKEFLADPGAAESFFREAAILARLDHPRIVRLLGVGETGAGGRFLLLDWMASDLTQHVGKTSWKQGLPWMIDAAEALSAAHRCGVLHCDLKPSNLLLDTLGQVRLADFGLARTMAERPTVSWIVEGTAPYMAPEQASPAWGDVSPRTDVFGLGAVFYTLLTGHPPWPGKSVAEAVTLAASGAKVPDIRERRSDVPEPVANLIAKCLAKSPSERFASIDAALQTMRQLEGLPDSA